MLHTFGHCIKIKDGTLDGHVEWVHRLTRSPTRRQEFFIARVVPSCPRNVANRVELQWVELFERSRTAQRRWEDERWFLPTAGEEWEWRGGGARVPRWAN